MNFRAKDPKWVNRDRFVLSKGHAGAGVYAVLAEMDFMPISVLKNHYKNGSNLSGHVSHKGIPGVEFSTGSLGHGLSVTAGMALAAKINKINCRFFVLMGDGECDEGSVWEAIMFASHHKLINLTVVVDRNQYQSIYSTEDTLSLEPFADKWKSFGWEVIEVDGNCCRRLIEAFKKIDVNKPVCVIANTIKGKGVSFMENDILWHYRSPQGEEFKAAIRELENKSL
jgi:transketolase